MGKKILFTPIGNTDPIKYLHDGSMLHISRHYKPDVIYLYFTKEMAENHRKDNRYGIVWNYWENISDILLKYIRS